MAGGLTRFLQSLAAEQHRRATGDGELLRQFVARRDQAAFTALVQRHGPLVQGVCRRILHDDADVQDAFQATFLVLARRAHSVGRPELLAHWLYGVACRTALRARQARRKRQLREGQFAAARHTAVVPELPPPDVASVVDEELSRLPSRLQAPVVLCYLRGMTNAEAAVTLGWPKGTVASRLARARERLRARLTRRGLAPEAVVILPIQDAFGSAALPRTLVTSTTQVAASPAAGLVSERVVELAGGTVRTMNLCKYRNVAALALAAGLLGVPATLLTRAVLQAAPPTAPAPEAPAADPKAMARARVEAARAAYEGVKKVWKQEPTRAKPDDEYQWSRRWMEAEQALAPTKADRVAAIKAHLERMKQLHATADGCVKGGVLFPYEAKAAEYYHLEAAQWLLDAEAR